MKRAMSHVKGIQPGQHVIGRAGRRFRVLSTSEFVNYQDGSREGPYCRLQALDDRQVTVIYPRSWYSLPGETLELFA